MADSQSDSSVFSVRIVSIDYHMAPPIPGLDICYSSFQGGKVNEVPVIRIYGSTPAGQKTCLHVHRALPYLYIPCEDLMLQPHQQGDARTHLISLAIEKALKLKGNAGLKRQHVHGCSLVRARKFYGYHSSEELFAKIYLYYPHDVSRAANLLLGGAVLDKSVQPYESHIPFLLQFLVDYNLYGMGHLHVSNLKFRHPVPNAFSRRKAIGQNGQGTHNAACASASLQADSSRDECFGSSVWISSTIPDGWMWKCLSQPDAPSDQDIHLVRRQSTCELEGDTTVDEILNQRLKMYTSLSQTQSDVKMVQSLISIWEEEYERTGMPEAAVPFDPGKPLPEDVLRTLAHGLEFENRLMELCSGAENYPSCTLIEKDAKLEKSIRSLTDKGDLVELELVNPKNDHGELSKCLKYSTESVSMLSQGSPCEEDAGRVHGLGRERWLKQPTVDEMQISETTGTSDMKVAEKEVLGLLRWLASSQVADDINSDDELAHETILSPFLPAATIDKVLEKANLDYESESQQECQDILDSIEDSMNFKVLNGSASCSIADSHPCQTSSEKKTIPQADGSADGQNSIPNAGKSSKIEMNRNFERLSQDPAHKEFGSSFTNKRKRMKKIWGSLPLSLTEKVNDSLQAVNLNMTSNCGCESKDDTVTGRQVEIDKCVDVSVCHADRDVYESKEENALVGCSVRDLMRRKRCYRVEPAESDTQRVRKTFSEEEIKEDLCLFPRKLEFHTQQNDGEDKRPLQCADQCFGSSERLDNEVGKQASTGSGNFTIIGPPPLHSGPEELPLFLNSDNHNSAMSSGNCENDNHGELGSVVNCMQPVSSDLCVCKPIQMPKFDTDNKLLDNEILQQKNDSAKIYCSTYVEGEVLGSDGYIFKNGNESRTFMQTIPEMSSENFEGKKTTTGATVLQFENCGEHHKKATSLTGSSMLSVFNLEANPIELIGMTFHQKPPIVDSVDGTFENASFSIAVTNQANFGDRKNYEGTSVQGIVVDEFLPFFMGDSLEEIQNKGHRNNDFGHRQEAALGVPTHYQNDGSCLYILTPASSPPSADSVSAWLLHDGTGICGDKFNETSVEASSQNGSSGSQISPQGSVPDACKNPLLESGSISYVKPVLDELNQPSHGNFNAQINPLCNKERTILRNESNIVEVKECTGHTQDLSQISGPDGKSKPTPLSQIGFRDPASVGGGQQLTLLSIEVQAESRGDLRPDPRFDAINVIVLAIQDDNDDVFDIYVLLRSKTEHAYRNLDGISGCTVLVSSEEKHLFNHFINIICTIDPDVLMGWDIQGGSLGFLAERASYIGIGLLNNISRTPSETKIAATDSDVPARGVSEIVCPEPLGADFVPLEDAIIEDEWGRTHASGFHVGGRIVLNIWRLMRGEVKLNMYTVEAVGEAVLRRKIPSLHSKILAKWFSSGPGQARYRCIEYVVAKTRLNLEIMNKLDMINRTSELARVFGIDFFSVLSRGSQYRVESMLLRLAHTQNYLAISPGNQQVASQPAMECLPLVMEPESGFYSDPVVVLDFQSLYPSMIIAYNLCFCTCLGNVTPSKANTLGVSSFSPAPSVLRDLKKKLLLTPNGVMHVPSKVREGILPRLLEEILSTRIMLKQAMKKLTPSQQILHRIFNARQLALKLIANVTYGYTAAGFSGRMPCAELADSIVQCGRRTLENAISFVDAHDKWKAKVIYGDTDSMFVLLKGRTVKESFQIGHEIATAVTAMNPNPVTLKMEKVYHPCFLLTKKRYVGYSYENPDQMEPVFDAKGIETVRRDTCGAVVKTMEQSLRLFFENKDINKVRAYLQRQWTRILSGRFSLQDFVFAKEVHLGTYSTRASSLPPAAIVATKAMRADPRAEPRYAERIPYVVVHGEPGSRLVDMVVDPLDLLAIDSPFRLNDLYYIRKQIIPALQRVFGLVGADLYQWFSDMPRPGRESIIKQHTYASNAHRTRIDYYYLSKHCILCGEMVQASAHLCGKCSENEAAVATSLVGRTSKLERELQHLVAMCRHCGGGDWLTESGVKCSSLACSVFYDRRKAQKELQAISAVATEAGVYPRCMVEWF